MIAQYSIRCGAIAQLGERIVRNDEVVGSIPTSSTIVSITCGTCPAASCPFCDVACDVTGRFAI